MVRLLFMLVLAAVVCFAVYTAVKRGFDSLHPPLGQMVFEQGRLVSAGAGIPASLRDALAQAAGIGGVSGQLTVYGDGKLDFEGPMEDGDKQRFRNAVRSVRG